MSKSVQKNVVWGALVLGLIFVFSVRFVRAADQSNQPTFLFSWRAIGNTPAGYLGKTLPIYQGSIILSVTMLQGDREISLNGAVVKWFINGDLVAHGVGLGSILFENKKVFGGGELDVKVSVQSIDSTTGNNGIQSGYFTIPIASPKVVVMGSPFNNSFSPGQTINLAAVPFFFTSPVSALSFVWTLNGSVAQSTGDPSHLSINLDSQAVGGDESVGVVVSNPARPGIETGAGSYYFSVQ